MMKIVTFNVTTYSEIKNSLENYMYKWNRNPFSMDSKSMFPDIRYVIWMSVLTGVHIDKIRFTLTKLLIHDLTQNRKNKINISNFNNYILHYLLCDYFYKYSPCELRNLLDVHGLTIPDEIVNIIFNRIIKHQSTYDNKKTYLLGWWKLLKLTNASDNDDAISKDINTFIKHINNLANTIANDRCVDKNYIKLFEECEDDELCVMCLAFKANTILLPCTHQTLCTNCIEKWTSGCPVCLKYIIHYNITKESVLDKPNKLVRNDSEILPDNSPILIDENRQPDSSVSTSTIPSGEFIST